MAKERLIFSHFSALSIIYKGIIAIYSIAYFENSKTSFKAGLAGYAICRRLSHDALTVAQHAFGSKPQYGRPVRDVQMYF